MVRYSKNTKEHKFDCFWGNMCVRHFGYLEKGGKRAAKTAAEKEAEKAAKERTHPPLRPTNHTAGKPQRSFQNKKASWQPRLRA